MEIFDLNTKIVNRQRNNRKYFSFIYSYRKNKSLKHIEKGIGYDKIPSYEKLVKLKEQFYELIIEKRFKNNLDKIKNGFDNSLGKYPIEIKRQEMESFGIRFTYDSNKIEGSPINLRETAFLVEKGWIYGFKHLNDVLETIAHFKVFNIFLDSKEEISLDLILNWHKALYKDTKDFAGKFRDETISRYSGKKGVNVSIRGSEVKFPDYKNIKKLMNQLIEWYNEKKEKYHPVLLSGLFKFKFVNIHPFADGNGRISRLVMNYILHTNDYPMMNIEYLKRKTYYTALERSNLQNNEMIFVNWYLKYYIKNYYFGFYSNKQIRNY